MVVHCHDHGNKNDGVVEQVKLNSWNPYLQKTSRYFRMKPIVVRSSLVEQYEMLDVVPELVCINGPIPPEEARTRSAGGGRHSRVSIPNEPE